MMPDRQLETYRVYTRFVKRLLILGGIHSEKRENNAVYRHVSTIPILSSVIVLCSIGNYCLYNIKNLKLLTKSLGIFGSVIAVGMKASLFRIYNKKLTEINADLDDLVEDALKEPETKSVLFSLLRFFYRPAHALTFVTMGIGVVYVVKPLAAIAHQIGSNETMKRSLPYPGRYPWTIEDSMLLYQLHYVFETQLCWFIVCITAAADTQFGLYSFQISALLRVVTYEFESLRGSDNVDDIVRRCVEKHVRLLQCRDVVQKVYGPIVLLMALTNALMMCTFIFQAVQLDERSIGKYMMLMFYMVMKIWQTFLYAWCGQTVTSESEILLRDSTYSGWYENGEKSFASSILVVTAQRPITLSACYFFKISLEFFVKIINTTVSYFFLLQTLDDAE